MTYLVIEWLFIEDFMVLFIVFNLTDHLLKKVTLKGFIMNCFKAIFFAFFYLFFSELVYIFIVVCYMLYEIIRKRDHKLERENYQYLDVLVISSTIQFVLFSLSNFLVNLLLTQLKIETTKGTLNFKESAMQVIASCLLDILLVLLLVYFLNRSTKARSLGVLIQQVNELNLNKQAFQMLFSFFCGMELIIFISNMQKITAEIQLVLIVVFFTIILFMYWQVILFAQNYAVQKESVQQAHYNQQISDYLQEIERQNNEIRQFKHDFNNILISMEHYVRSNDVSELKDYYVELSKQEAAMDNLQDLRLAKIGVIKNDSIKSILVQKFFQARRQGIYLNLELEDDSYETTHNIVPIIRVIGILLDNAIEYAKSHQLKEIHCAFINFGEVLEISVENELKNDVNISQLMTAGYSTKKNHSGLGLANVKMLAQQEKGLYLNISKKNHHFQVTLIINNGVG